MRLLEFSNDRLEFTMIINRALVNKRAQIDIISEALEPTPSSKYIVHRNFFKTKQENFIYFLECNYYIYDRIAKQLVGENNKLPTQINIYMKLSIFDDENNLLAEKECEDFYRIHFVRYIPDILNLKKWYLAKNLQDIWFCSDVNTNYRDKNPGPLVDQIEWRWIMKYPEVANEFLKFDDQQRNPLFKKKKDLESNIRREIEKMIECGYAKKPTKEDPEQDFGYFGDDYRKIGRYKKTYGDEDAPLFENFYHSNYEYDKWDVGQELVQNFGVNEFIAAIAQFSFHVYATGKLRYISEGKTEVFVESFVYYLWDRFNFTNDPEKGDEELGLWKIIETENGKNDFKVDIPIMTFDETGKYEVTNDSYNNYRRDHKMGGDFSIYSTRHVVKLYYTNPRFIL